MKTDKTRRFTLLHNNNKPVTFKKAPGRNDKCHCNSGKKYKNCCLVIDQEQYILK